MLRSDLPRCAALIFDMDGLLLDTESTYALAWRRAAQTLGSDLDDDFCASLAGLHYQAVEARIEAYCGGLDREQFRQFSGRFWREHVDAYGIELKAGFDELLAVLDGTALPYCLATNSRSQNAEECLRLAGVSELFPLRLTRDHVQEGKPAPEIFFKAAAALDTGIEQCWVIEDSYTGICAARSAGAFAICIPSPGAEGERAAEAADLVLQNLAQLGDIIRARTASAVLHDV